MSNPSRMQDPPARKAAQLSHPHGAQGKKLRHHSSSVTMRTYRWTMIVLTTVAVLLSISFIGFLIYAGLHIAL